MSAFNPFPCVGTLNPQVAELLKKAGLEAVTPSFIHYGVDSLQDVMMLDDSDIEAMILKPMQEKKLKMLLANMKNSDVQMSEADSFDAPDMVNKILAISGATHEQFLDVIKSQWLDLTQGGTALAIARQEVERVLGQALPAAKVHELVEKADSNHDNLISFEEFTELFIRATGEMTIPHETPRDPEVAAKERRILQQSGLRHFQLIQIIKKTFLEMSRGFPAIPRNVVQEALGANLPEQAWALVEKADKDHDQQISFEEFVDLYISATSEITLIQYALQAAGRAQQRDPDLIAKELRILESTRCTHEQLIRSIKRQFLELSKGTNVIARPVVEQALSGSLSAQKISELVDKSDADRNSEISFDEFVDLYIRSTDEITLTQQVAAAFAVAQRREPELVAKEKRILESAGATHQDLMATVRAQWERLSNGRSAVTRAEVEKSLGVNLDSAKIAELINKSDKDHDNSITFEEFVDLFIRATDELELAKEASTNKRARVRQE